MIDYSFAQLPTTLPVNQLPIIITGPGDYVTRSGLLVRIIEIVPYVPHPNGPFLRHEVTAFEAKGSVWRIYRGKLRPKDYSAWHLSGLHTPMKESPLDIVAVWKSVTYTYTPDILRPQCATCGSLVQQNEGDPEQPWEGTCPAGHVHTYQLEDEEDDPCE